MKLDELSTLVDKAVSDCRQLGAEQAEVSVNYDTGFSVTARLGQVETIERHQQQGLQVSVIKNQSKGVSSSNDLKPESIQQAIEAALNIAGFTAKDECAGLAPENLLAHDYPDLQLYHHWPIEPQQAAAMAIECEQFAQQHPAISNSEGATVSSLNGMHAYANSHGFSGAYASSQHSISCSVVAKDESGMQRDYWYSIARAHEDLDPLAHVGEMACKRAVDRLGARKIATCEVPVMFEPNLARGLIGHFISAISGGALYRNASFLKDKLQQKIFPEWLSISERPHIPKALGSAPFDQDGVALQDRNIVEQGVLKGYVLSQYSANRLGMQTTGNAGGIHNLQISDTGQTQKELLRDMDAGLLVTELIGHGVNTVTGDYSRGAAGYWVENGEIQYPVEEITIAGNLLNMFANIIASGTDVDARGKIRCGSLLLDRMMVAGG